VSLKAPALVKGHTQITDRIGETFISHLAWHRGRLSFWESVSEIQQQTLSFVREIDGLLIF